MNKIREYTLVLFLFFFLIFDFYFLLRLENFGEFYSTLIQPINFFINKKIQEGLYPFFFNSLNGLDIIGESEASPLYPVNFILSFFNIDVDLKYNILICSYLIVGLVGIFFFIKKKINLIAVLVYIYFLLIPYFRVNFVHHFWIGSFIYFLIIIFVYILKIENKISDKNFNIFTTILISLLILIGNFTLQWIFLTALITALFFLSIKFKKSFLLFILPIVFGGLISFLQIILTLDLMQTSDRSLAFFDYSKFNNFIGGYAFSNFFNGFSSFSISDFFDKGISGFSTDNLVYIGLLPLICIFSDIRNNNIFNSPVKLFLFFIFVIAFFRGLGGLFLPNFILKSLPIFGQMRSVFRDLMTIQVVFLAYFFYLVRENKIVLDKTVTLGLVILSFLIFLSNEIFRFIETKQLFYLNFIYLIFPFFYFVIIFFKKEKKFKVILIVCIFELLFVNSFYPMLLGKKEAFDEIKNCNLPLKFSSKHYDAKPTKLMHQYDHTVYKNIFGNHPFENSKVSINSNEKNISCPLVHYIDNATLTSVNTKLFFEKHNTKENNKFLNLYLSLLFPNVSISEVVRIDDFLKINKHLFIEIKFNSTELKTLIFSWMKRLNVNHYFLVEKNYKPLSVFLSNKLMNIVPYGDKRILIFDSNEDIVKANIVGPFNLIEHKYKTINIYYVPLFELIGLIISFFSFILFIIYIKYKK